MGTRKRHLFIFLLILTAVFAEFDTLQIIGHIPGAACMSVEYSNGRLYAGAGSSLFIYDCLAPADMELAGYVNFISLVTNIVVRDDSMVFVGANHDGLYAVDASEPDFPIVAQYKMIDHSHWIGDLELSPPDTLWMSDFNGLKQMLFTGDTFIVYEEYFDGDKIAGVGFKDTLLAVCRRHDWGILGYVDFYKRMGTELTFIASFDSSRLWYIMDAEFADNRNDIIYVLGGSPNLGADGDFYALHYDGDSLYVADGHKFSGIPMFAQTYIMNMDSKNDTVFLATMAALYWSSLDSTWSDCPALDGNFLPDSMPIIGHFVPGLWFFDVALHDDYPALATGSEWLGVWWTSIADFDERLDTIRTYPTGGWGQHSYLYGGDTLFIAMEGYGVAVFDVGEPSVPERVGRIPGSFAHDMAFLDSIICVARSAKFIFFNLAPFWRGGEIEVLDTFEVPLVFGETHICHSLALMETNDDTFFVLATSDEGINLIDPRDIPGVYTHAHFFDNTDPLDVRCCYDTLFVMMTDSFHVAWFDGDTIESIYDCATPGEALGFYKGGDFVAIACKGPGVFWYRWEADSLALIGNWNPWGLCADVEYFDSLLYIACAGEGLYILDIEDFPAIDTLAWFPGSGGWEFLQYGSQHVYFGPDSTIFLSDYHAACYILEKYVRDPYYIRENGVDIPKSHTIWSSPNPFNSSVQIEVKKKGVNSAPREISIYDVKGRLIDKIEPDPIERETVASYTWRPDEITPSGLYLVKAEVSGEILTAGIVFLK